MPEHLPSWLRRLVGARQHRPRGRIAFMPEVLPLGGRRRTPAGLGFRPGLEVLEARLAPAALPTVADPTASGINTATALLGGNVTNDGGAPVTTRGVVYSLTSVNPNPSLGGPGVTEVTVPPAPPPGTGAYTVPVAPLTPARGYSFKAFAVNSEGASYSGVATFTTAANVLMPAGPALTPDAGKVLFLGPDSGPQMVPLKKITFTNNSAKTVYPFLEDPNTTETKKGSGIALYDPNDAYNQEYREYIGYRQDGVNYFGLPSGMTVTVSVPLVFWNGGRIDISDDPTYLVTNATVAAPANSPNPFQYYAFQAGSTAQDPDYTLASVAPAQSSSGGPAGVSGVVLYYHSLVPSGPANDAPSQLLEFTIRDTYLKTLSTASLIPDSEKHPLVNYDVSYVDSMALPVAMEATDVPVPIPNPNNPTPPTPPVNPPLGPRLPYGWIGSDQTVDQFQSALQKFADTGSANGLGMYFAGDPTNGWPQYNFNVLTPGGSPAYPNGVPVTKVPSGQSVFADSPLGSHPSSYNDNYYSLTSGGSGPFQIAGGVGGSSTGTDAVSFSQGEIIANQAKLKNLAVGMVVGSSTPGYSVPAGVTVTGITYQTPGDASTPVVGVTTSAPVPSTGSQFPSGVVYTFVRPLSDYAAGAMADLWYTWANYYVMNNKGVARTGLDGGTDDTNVLTLKNAPAGLVPGMAVTGPGISTVPADGQTTILSINGNVIRLSEKVTADSGQYNFTLPSLSAILGSSDPSLQLLKNFDPTAGAPKGVPNILQFAQNVYQVMSFMSSIPLTGKAPASIQLMNNVIGGNIGMVPNIGNVPAGKTAPPVKALIEVPIRDKIKSLLRGVGDFTAADGVQNDQANWYPNPSARTGNQNFNVYNLDPFVWFVHVKLGLSGYGFSLDDDVADIGADWGTALAVSIGGLNGLPNHMEYTPGAPYGVVSATATASSGTPNQLLGMPVNAFWSVMPDAPDTGNVGAFVTGPGIVAAVPPTNLQKYGDLNAHNFFLSRNLQNVPDGTYTYTFFGAGTANTAPLVLSGTANAAGPYTDTSTLEIPAGSALNVTGTLNRYTQELQQLAFLTGLVPPALGTTVDGTLTAGLVDVVNGFLAGTGTVTGPQGTPATVDVNGPVGATKYQEATPGAVLLPGSTTTPGRLSVTGDVTMYGATFRVVANGAGAAGTHYSQLVSSGTVSLGHSDLDVSLVGGYVPDAGDTLTIISAAKVTGTFGDGNRVTVRSGGHDYVFAITYNANSVVLTFTPQLRGRKPPGGPPHPRDVLADAVEALVGPPNPSAGSPPAPVAVPSGAHAGLPPALAEEEAAAITAIARARLQQVHAHVWTASELALSHPRPATGLRAAFIF